MLIRKKTPHKHEVPARILILSSLHLINMHQVSQKLIKIIRVTHI